MHVRFWRSCEQNFLLHDVLGFGHSEIVQRLGCSIGNSKSQLHKARNCLQWMLGGKPGRPETSVAAAFSG